MKKSLMTFFILFFVSGIFSDENNAYKTAVILENQGRFDEAIGYYKEFIASSSNKALNEKVALKLARISTVYDESIKYYKEFFEKYPYSKYTSLARYELAELYKLYGNFKEALREYSFIAANEKEKAYYRRKAGISCAELEIELGKLAFAVERLYTMLNNPGDYEDSGRIYYFLGIALLKQGLFSDAEKLFLTSAGSFPLSSKSATSLYQLVKIYISTGKKNEALRVGKILTNLYPDSLEAKKIKESIAKINEKGLSKFQGIELIDLNKETDILNNANLLIEKDFIDSLSNGNIDKIESNSAYYIQLGYFSTVENAKVVFDDYIKTGIKDLFIARTRANEAKKIFYRIVSGPFYERSSANKKILELKEKNIEAIVLELVKVYE